METEDTFYSRAIALCDEAMIAMNDAMETGTLNDDQFYFLSYLLSRSALSIKVFYKFIRLLIKSLIN